MDFDQQKKIVLEKLFKPDKSKKGGVDEKLVPLINLINSHNDFYTTSSCSGRIMLFSDNDSKIKTDASWLFVSHEIITFEQIEPSLEILPEAITSFKMEGMILHIACRTLETAKQLIIFSQNNGYKHTGLLSLSKRFIVQIMGVERFDAPIAKSGSLLVSKEYLKLLIESANKKLLKTHNKIDFFFENFKKEFFDQFRL